MHSGLWFWDVGGMGLDRILHEPRSRTGPLGVNSVHCYTCGANFAWPSGITPTCPICRSSATCDNVSKPEIEFFGSAGYVRDDDDGPPPLPQAR